MQDRRRRLDRRGALARLSAAGLAGTALGAGAVPVGAQTAASVQGLEEAFRILFSNHHPGLEQAFQIIGAYDGVDAVPALILALRFNRGLNRWIEPELQRLTGRRDTQGWFDWMLWQEAHSEVVPHPSYYKLKRELFLRIDPNFDDFIRPEHIGRDAARIRFEEVTWGGVIKDGIPSLDNPDLIAARAADYLRPDDLVFGVAINGDARAYPLRIMGWHEMFNEVIGGVPLALAYCTLCGAGFLFETKLADRPKPFIFGSSGFLYRSNKLMFDRGTNSLWNQYTGEPVIGPLAHSGIALKRRPVTIAPWKDWLAAQPETKVLSVETGHRRDYGSGVVYRQYFASPDLMFPAEVDQTRLAQKDYVFGVATAGAARAWPLAAFKGEASGAKLINDRVGGLSLALIGDAAGRTVRAYDRGARMFELDSKGRPVADGAVWRITEEALIAPNGETAPRVAGRLSYWFAWSGYLGASATLYPE